MAQKFDVVEGGKSALDKLIDTKPTTAANQIATFRRTKKEPAEIIQRAGSDLRWYYEEREAAMGFCSCGIGPGDGAGGDDEDPRGINEEAILRVVGRERPIRRALQSLAWRDQCALEAYFDYAPRWQGVSVVGLARLDEWAAVAFFTDEARVIVEARGGHTQNARKVIADHLANKETAEVVVTDLKLAAQALLKGACGRYLEAKLRLGVR
jgi:hypothetical protein